MSLILNASIQGNQQFTGSVDVTGSLSINGVQLPTAGTQGAQGVQGTQGLQGANGQSNAYFNYQAKTGVTSGDPASGHIIWNNATQTAATSFNVSDTDNNSNNVDIFLSNIGVGSIIVLQDKNSQSNYQQWQITSKTDNTTYWTYGATYLGGGYSFTNNQDLLFIIASYPTGPQGTQGVQGVQGTSGTNGAQGATGSQGANGIQGTAGTNGAQGANGAQGTAGTNGSQGIQGVQGTAGTNGSQGIQGISGTNGSQGIQGIQGITGTGIQGSTGAQGTSGTNGSQGATGAQGTAGTNGSQGTTGSTGPQGSTGSTGPQGSTGGTGPQGSTGSTGPQGATGSQGASGASGGVSSFTNGADNRVVTATSATGINGEANMTFDGSTLAVTGDIHATGDVAAYYSDGRLKNIISKIDNPLEKLKAISGYYYTQNELAEEFGYNDYGRQVGVIAQEINEVLPEVITRAPFDNDGNGGSRSGEYYMTVYYQKIIPLLIEAIKELDSKIK